MPPTSFPSEPNFILQCNAAVTTIKEIEIDQEKLIAVGTQLGNVFFYGDDYKLRTHYEESNKQAILNIIQVKNSLLIHVRSQYVILLKRADNGWINKILYNTSFPGFCQIAYLDGKLIIPLSERNRNSMLIARLESNSLNFENSHIVLFTPESASPMCAEVDNDMNSFLIGDDVGTLTVVDSSSGERKQISLCKNPIFALASSSEYIAAGSSVDSPIFLLRKKDLTIAPIKISYIQKAAGIYKLCFSPSGSTLFGAFWDGMFRGYSTKKFKEALAVSLQDDNISTIGWTNQKKFVAGSKEGRLSIWEL